jgi:glutamyl-tRNA synthetase
VGNLRTAWISHLFARHLNLPWVVRFEDIDKPRITPGAQDQQLADMRTLGLSPDQALIQSQFFSRHFNVFKLAFETGQVYACDCSRKDVQLALANLASAPNVDTGLSYSGHCRSEHETHKNQDQRRILKTHESIAWRFKMPNPTGVDDFIIARSQIKMGQVELVENSNTLITPHLWTPAYHWACAIDDFDGNYDLIVRSIDLASAAPLQRAIQMWLAGAEKKPPHLPAVFHTTLVTQNDGRRLEKRTKGVTLTELSNLGITPQNLIEKFRTSFDFDLLSRSFKDQHAIQSEQKKSISLADLKLG